jgi:dUTP pyrophosphatase
MKVKRLSPTATLPTRAHDTDAGYDVYSDETVRIKQGSRAKIKLGVALGLPPGWCALMFPRSGLSAKQGTIVLANVIDAGYTGEIHLVAVNHGDGPWDIKVGDKVAQFVVVPCLADPIIEVDELTAGARGTKGFGSSGV